MLSRPAITRSPVERAWRAMAVPRGVLVAVMSQVRGWGWVGAVIVGVERGAGWGGTCCWRSQAEGCGEWRGKGWRGIGLRETVEGGLTPAAGDAAGG